MPNFLLLEVASCIELHKTLSYGGGAISAANPEPLKQHATAQNPTSPLNIASLARERRKEPESVHRASSRLHAQRLNVWMDINN
eukprot:6188059-Pleurochrysis_carterae.AAC.1